MSDEPRVYDFKTDEGHLRVVFDGNRFGVARYKPGGELVSFEKYRLLGPTTEHIKLKGAWHTATVISAGSNIELFLENDWPRVINSLHLAPLVQTVYNKAAGLPGFQQVSEAVEGARMARDELGVFLPISMCVVAILGIPIHSLSKRILNHYRHQTSSHESERGL